MSLPDLIEIIPLKEPVRAEITVPGSKSITNRALILAALAEGEVTLAGALWSEDTQIMTEALQKLGFAIRVEQDPDEFCNRTITVKGLGGKIPNAGAGKKPLELFVGNAGTAARFLAAFVCLGEGLYHFSGVERMKDRPQAALFKALRELGYRIEAEYGNDRLPAIIEGKGPAPGAKCKVSIEKSSQFASALLLCAKIGGWEIKVEGENAEESPYVAMTSKMIEAFPHKGGKFQIEPDASSGSYFWAAGVPELSGPVTYRTVIEPQGFSKSESRHIEFSVKVSSWPRTSKWQIDAEFPPIMAVLFDLSGNLRKNFGPNSKLPPPAISRQKDLGDSIMTAITLAPLALCLLQFTDLGRLRLQETERVKALRTELTKCGAKVVEEGDTLTVYPSELHGAEIETYEDHRMAMCFAVLGLKVPGIKIKNPACVKKTFPNFFQKLAAPPPKGLGATILDAASGRKLAAEELFAD
ncbi:MAG TPA: 3-phosphoshikimate 1-carboxyvinyltransferase [Pseudomonadales bacterium]|nr:3-phosphoshikimate 1-carboxyvinyltransferase [Pseudomonadales bacterium]